MQPQYYAPDYTLDVCASEDGKNMNTVRYLEANKTRIFENLRSIAGPPSVQMQDVPRSSLAFWTEPDAEDARRDADEDDHPDVRYTAYRLDRHIQKEELSDSVTEDGLNSAYVVCKTKQEDCLPKPCHNSHNRGEDIEFATYDRAALESERVGPGGPEQMIAEEQYNHGYLLATVYKPSPIEVHKPLLTKSLTSTTKSGFSSAVSPPKPARVPSKHPLDDPRCECCRTGKVKCDKARPFCGTCVRRGRSHLCLYRRLDGTIGPDPGAEAVLALAEGVSTTNMELD